MSYKFAFKNPGATTSLWPDLSDWRMNRYFDKPGDLWVELKSPTGIAPRAIVDAYLEDEYGASSYSTVQYRGYVLPPDQDISSQGTIKLNVPDITRILDRRFTQLSRWSAGTTLTKMLTHDWPSPGEVPGALCQANNLVQAGSFITLSGNVWKLPQGGTRYLGSIHTLGDHVYIDSVQQTWGSSTSLSSGQYWQDADYLYIYSTKNPYYSVVLVEGCYETGIRLGTKYTLPSTPLTHSWRSANSQIASLIGELIQSFGLEYAYRFEPGSYTYLDATTTIGRGASATNYPTFKWDKAIIKKLQRNTTAGGVPIHTLKGLGIGKGATRQYHAEVSFPPGLRFIEQIEESSQFAEQLQGTVLKKYNDLQDMTAWSIEAAADPAHRPGDYIKVVPELEQPVIERIKQISESPTGVMKIFAGQRPFDADDVIRAERAAQDQKKRDLELQYTAITVSDQANVDSNTPCDIILQVKAADWDSELASTWSLNVGIKGFENTITQVSTAEVNHGTGGAETTTGDGGSHNDHDLGISGVTSQTSAMNVIVPDFIQTDDAEPDDPHYHLISPSSLAYASSDEHVHDFQSGTYPDSNEEFSLDTYSNPGQTADKTLGKDVSTALGGGSSWVAYLTVTIKIINATYPAGQAVPGSPFYDIAINEDLPDIDVSGLIVAGENKVNIAIARYGTPGPGETTYVKARANASVCGNFVVEAR